ncbi:MAG: polysaccharide biosynthesis protein [Deltaproteobacteria bacterium CG_4_9_14_3_um_filter_63_12]|nr:MAG: polysaccharide biosynthesis protein [Deltaproteobacteria bacterium CG_4_9_14_3_um_filter_63_12]
MLRFATRTTQDLLDLLVLSAAFWMAFLLRFELELSLPILKRAMFGWPYVVGFEYFVLVSLGVTRFAWRYIGLREITRLLVAISLASFVFVVLRIVTEATLEVFPYSIYAMLPLGVIAINYTFAFMGVAGLRVLRRLFGERQAQIRHTSKTHTPAVPTILIGAGEAGVIVAKEIRGNPGLGIQAVGFVDDDRAKLGSVIHGLTVLGTTADLGVLAEEHGAEQALITIANAGGGTIRNLVRACEAAGLPAKIIPGIFELLDGRVNLQRIRDVSVEDLLGRQAVELDNAGVSRFLTGKNVLVTGAGGSIGSELCRQVAHFEPASLILVERSEFHLYSIHRTLLAEHPDLTITPVICDVGDAARVERIFEQEKPDVVFHAAAHKHVPMMELNPGEAVKNNVFGTLCVAEAAERHHAEAFVMVSTDKAVNPTSIMGATKRVAEIVIQALDSRSDTKFVAVRFGNVLGSTGSVIPLFKEQIAAGGPVTVTHPEMVRYFMTIPEAAQLVMQSAAMGAGGEIFVLDMGEPVRIVDLARDLIRLSGFEPEVDIAIEFVGTRPGEKLFEELGFNAEKMDKTVHPKIFVGKLASHTWDEVLGGLEVLEQVQESCDRQVVRRALKEVVPEMLEPKAEAATGEVRPSRSALEPARLESSVA